MTNYIILLPPSETKKKDGDATKSYRMVKNLKKYNYFISLESDRDYIYGKIREAIAEENEIQLEKTFELKEKNLQHAVEINSDLLNENTMPVIERYQGTMFNAINYDKLGEKQKENLNNSVIFIDGMFGLLKPQDLIPDYKLKITSKFLDIDVTNFWKERLKGYFKILFKEKLVIDILPDTHRKVIDYNGVNVLQVQFCTLKNNQIVNIGHNSKSLKGELIAYLLTSNNISKADFELFKHSKGYFYSAEHSTENEIVYLKK